MAPNLKKRRHPAGGANIPGQLQSHKKRKGNAVQPKRTVSTDELGWKTVPVTELFGDDAGGFLSLEEVTGVEVVKDGNSIKFVREKRSKGIPKDVSSKKTPVLAYTNIVGKAVPSEATNTKKTPAEEDGEWNGFSDDEEPVKPSKKPSKTNDAAKSKDKTKKEKQAAKGETAPEAALDGELESGGFALLADVINEDDSGVDVSAWAPLDLSPALLYCIRKLGFAKPTEIQSASIPQIVAGHDIVGTASTGSGKTLAFAIPIVQAWVSKSQSSGKRKSHNPTALILSPTRALAHQITGHIKKLCQPLEDARPYVCCVTGGMSVEKQKRELKMADIIVGTPGRIWDVFGSDSALLNALKGISFLVVDEADRLLSDGHFKDAEEILAALDKVVMTEDYSTSQNQSEPALRPRQTLVFSATFNRELQRKLHGKKNADWDDLAGQDEALRHIQKRLNFREENPQFIDTNPISHLAENLREGLLQCGNLEKDLYLYTLLMLQPSRRTIIFANAISTVSRLVPMLKNLELAVGQLHSGMGEAAQFRAVEEFTSDTDPKKPATGKRRGRILVATDIAARGLDIPGVDMVVHYHVPHTADTYVHRSGRTARAGQKGLSVLLCSPAEAADTQKLVARVHGKDVEIKGGQKNGSNKKSSKTTYYLHRVDLDHRLTTQLKERVDLAKKIADSFLAKDKRQRQDLQLSRWAEDLGADYDPDEYETGRKGAGRAQREKELAGMTKAEVRTLRWQLRQLIETPIVKPGLNQRYLTSGNLDMAKLLKDAEYDFLGKMDIHIG